MSMYRPRGPYRPPDDGDWLLYVGHFLVLAFVLILAIVTLAPAPSAGVCGAQP